MENMLGEIPSIEHYEPHNEEEQNEYDDIDSDRSDLQNNDEPLLFEDFDLQQENLPVGGENRYEYANLDFWTNSEFPWSTRLNPTLKQYFGFDSFRPIQKAVINATLSKRDVFLCIPTGSGKSLTFQLPAILNEGVTVVFMPLIALMQDQTDQLTAKNIKVLNLSGTAGAERNLSTILTQYTDYKKDYFGKGQIDYPRMIFLSPEKIAMSEKVNQFLKELYKMKLIERFVIDEAHCVSTWGHEFRKDYLHLKRLKTDFPGVPTLAMTATATENYLEDIIKQLGMRDVLYFQNSFNRENLVFEVRVKVNRTAVEQIANFIYKEYPGKTGIVYTTCIKDAEKVSNSLSKNFGIKSAFYHSKLPDKTRSATQNAWMKGEIQVIVATIAFGMGINKPDVRFVIHYNLAKSLAHYYQEAGRAGRDGLKSHCIIFYEPKDKKILEFFIAASEALHTVKRQNTVELYTMIKYCQDWYNCRRVTSLAYFGENFDKQYCKGYCDNCQANRQPTTKDMTLQAQKIAKFFYQRTGENYELEKLPRVLLGSGKKYKDLKVLDDGLNRDEVKALLMEMIISKYLYINYVKVKKRSRDSFELIVCVDRIKTRQLLEGNEKVYLQFPVYTIRKYRKLAPLPDGQQQKKGGRNRADRSAANNRVLDDDEQAENNQENNRKRVRKPREQRQPRERKERNRAQGRSQNSIGYKTYQDYKQGMSVSQRIEENKREEQKFNRQSQPTLKENDFVDEYENIDDNLGEYFEENNKSVASKTPSFQNLLSQFGNVRQKTPPREYSGEEIPLSSLSSPIRHQSQISPSTEESPSKVRSQVLQMDSKGNGGALKRKSTEEEAYSEFKLEKKLKFND